MTDDHSFVPSNQLPKVGPLPKADPKAPAAHPSNPGGLSGRPTVGNQRQPGNFNPNSLIDTSTATSSGPPRSWLQNQPKVDDDGSVHWPNGKPGGGNNDDSSGSDDDHYAVGHQLGMAIGQHLNNQMQDHINNQQAQFMEQLFQHLFG